jgi:hypothetical protein
MWLVLIDRNGALRSKSDPETLALSSTLFRGPGGGFTLGEKHGNGGFGGCGL